MGNGQQPILFKLRKINSGDDEFGGVAPFFPSKLPQSFGTPFGKTDSDIKNPTIPKPILFLVNGLKFGFGGVFHPVSAMNPCPPTMVRISGITKDETGTPAGGYTVYIFNMSTGVPVLFDKTVSDDLEITRLLWVLECLIGLSIIQSGSPDKAGASVDTLKLEHRCQIFLHIQEQQIQIIFLASDPTVLRGFIVTLALLALQSYTRGIISSVSGLNNSHVIFQVDKDWNQWEVRAGVEWKPYVLVC